MSLRSTGVNHTFEQENNSIKIQGGIKGVGKNESALEEHFLISCEMSQITEVFLESLHLNMAK